MSGVSYEQRPGGASEAAPAGRLPGQNRLGAPRSAR
jgi:hypothetical protein